MSRGSAGTWVARFYDGEQYHYKALGEYLGPHEKDRFDAAKAAAEEWFQHLGLGGATDVASVKAACDKYVDYLKIENSNTAALDAAGRFRRLVYGDPIARIDLAKLTAAQLSGWKKRVLDDGASKSAFNRNAASLRAALNLALKRRMIASDHAWVDELAPFKGAEGRRDLYLGRADRRKLIAKSAEEAQAIIRAMALLPLRPGDVAALMVADFDALHSILSIPAGKIKSRKIPLSGESLAHVKASAAGKLPAAWLFARADGRQWKKGAWRDAINDAVGAAKLPKAVCAYTLRHSAITDLVTSGLDLFHIGQLAGTSVAMIEKHYGQLRPQQMRDGLQVLSLK
jgi:integrase